MKRCISFITLLLFLMTVFSIRSFATNIGFSLKADNNINLGRAFDVYLSVSCSTDIGAFRIAIYFDSEKLVFKSAELYNKNDNDYLKYNSINNKIILVYLSDTNFESSVLNDIIKLRFSPVNNENADYIFESDIYEACDKNATLLECDEMPVLSLTVSDNGSKSQSTVKDTSETSLASNDISESNSENLYEKSDSSDFESSIVDEENSISESNYSNKNNEYSLSGNNGNITMQKDNFGVAIGIAVLIVAVAFVFYRIGSKNKQK